MNHETFGEYPTHEDPRIPDKTTGDKLKNISNIIYPIPQMLSKLFEAIKNLPKNGKDNRALQEEIKKIEQESPNLDYGTDPELKEITVDTLAKKLNVDSNNEKIKPLLEKIITIRKQMFEKFEKVFI